MGFDPTLTSVLEAAPSRPRAERTGSVVAFLGWLGHSLPTFLVLLGLGALAAWGHHTGWTMPKLAALGGATEESEEDWCAEHAVPESVCVACRPELLPQPPAPPFCKKHGVPECPIDHPEIAQVKGSPPPPRADAQAALALLDRPENNNLCKLHLRRLQFTSAADVEKAGIAVAPVREGPVVEGLAVNGEVAYDQGRVARLSSPLPGRVWRVEKQVGDAVREGELLALVDAAEVGKAKAEFLQAYVQVELRHRTWASLQQIAVSGAVAERQLREAETALSEARIRLLAAQQALVNFGLPVITEGLKGRSEEEIAATIRFLGLPEAVAARLDPRTTTGNLLPVRSPLDGVVVAREVVAGEGVEPARQLFVVADTRRMWLNLAVRSEDAGKVALGQPVRFRPDGEGREAVGRVAWISTAADEKTRTVRVRADLDNAEGRLRANTFGRGLVVLREEPYAVLVPSEAVHWEGCCHVVFVRGKDFFQEGAPKVFHPRKVIPGVRDGTQTEILAGVLPGEVVAARGSGVLRGELLKNNLGAG